MRYLLFRDSTRRMFVVGDGRFDETYRSPLQGNNMFHRKVSIRSPPSAAQRRGRARSSKNSNASDAYRIFWGNLLKICPFVRSEEEEIILKRTFGVEFGTQVCILVLYFTGSCSVK